MAYHRPDNPNNKFRTVFGTRSYPPTYNPPLLTEAELAVWKAQLEERVAKELRRQPRVSKGHLLNVRKYMPYIRRCRQKCRPPRRVPRKVLETVVALSLV